MGVLLQSSAVVWIGSLILLGISSSFALDKDLILTLSQKKTLDEFRESVLPLLTEEYMRDEIFLVRWLRAQDFNVQRAKDMLENSLKWRKKYKMDGILDEDWSNFESRFKTDLEGIDKYGRPIYYIQLGTWDVRSAAVAGEIDKLSRYMNKGTEAMVRKVRQLQAQGQNVTQYIFVANIGGFSLAQQGCFQCLPIYINFAAAYELYYPGMASKMYLVNTPSIFEVVLNGVRPVLSPLSRESLMVFGSNRQTYEPQLFKNIDRDQLPPEVGGTKEFN